MKLSAIVITKNAEELIADCLDSLQFCDEIIVVDDGSKDRTVDLAKHLGAKTFSFISQSFAQQRDFGLKKAKGDWVLYIDSDERVTTELKKNILDAIDDDVDRFAAYRLQRKNYYLGNNEWPHVEKLERFFKKDKISGWQGQVHETAEVKGEIGELEGFLTHFTHRNLTQMLEKTIEWSEIEAELRYKANHPKMSWWRFLRVMLSAFWDSYVRQKGYKAGVVGVIESIYQAFSMFITYARLWEMQNKARTKNEK